MSPLDTTIDPYSPEFKAAIRNHYLRLVKRVDRFEFGLNDQFVRRLKDPAMTEFWVNGLFMDLGQLADWQARLIIVKGGLVDIDRIVNNNNHLKIRKEVLALEEFLAEAESSIIRKIARPDILIAWLNGRMEG